MEAIRINKYLSEKGICSRREADRLLEEGKILVNGAPAAPGQKVTERDKVTVKGKTITAKEKTEPVLLAFYKPTGVVTTTSKKDKATNIVEFLNYPTRVYPIGRLDKESEGLILMTNRGELVNAINCARYGHEKEYIVRCERKLTARFLQQMAAGVEIEIPKGEEEYMLVKTRPCRICKLDDYSFSIILTQGYNRQIRRMTAALGNKVTRLKRIRVMNISIGTLKEGEYRIVKGSELKELEKTLRLK